MILSKLYSHNNAIFEPIVFNTGVNIILGEIRNPKNKKKDTHNLGKSLIASLLDFCLVKKKDKEFFLYKNEEHFQDFVFFLEIKLSPAHYITIKRSVSDGKVSIREHENRNQNFSNLAKNDWTHASLAFGKARKMVDSLLDIALVKPSTYRKPLNYALRSQVDFAEVFHLTRFGRGRDNAWKPLVAQILGLDHSLLERRYELQKSLTDLQEKNKKDSAGLADFVGSIDKLDGLIRRNEDDIRADKESLQRFDFHLSDTEINTALVEKLDSKIAFLNEDRYYLSGMIEKMKQSLKENLISFNPQDAQKIFKEVGLLFEGQVKKTYEDLIQFNKDISSEREAYLRQEIASSREKLSAIDGELRALNKERSTALENLGTADVVQKYKDLSQRVSNKETNLIHLNEQKKKLDALRESEKEAKLQSEELEKNQKLIQDDVQEKDKDTGAYATIKQYFSEIVKKLTDKEALISCEQNSNGNLDFKADFINLQGTQTSESDGNTYKKILCMAFDMAVNRFYLDKHYIHFTFHDGFLDTLDDRKKYNFLNYIRNLADEGYQYIGTLIDSQIPAKDPNFFNKEEIIVRLHDEGITGLLFKMKPW